MPSFQAKLKNTTHLSLYTSSETLEYSTRLLHIERALGVELEGDKSRVGGGVLHEAETLTCARGGWIAESGWEAEAMDILAYTKRGIR